ncbi:hypothetical protein [Parasediminibacterium sp. JCM 36343]|uniref:hypothetical protein n=1 Tax=Parasediminibacterium sp. JCM 36343 TaxID=3374279 RepID=UPI00397A09F6
MLKKHILAYSFFVLTSCGHIPSIENPLPTTEKELKSFPSNMQGDYLNSDDNSILTITNNSVTKTYDFDFKFLKDSIGTNNYIKDDTMFDKYSNEKEKVKLLGDTIVQHVYKSIPLFEISQYNVLKEYKGHYFLNNRSGGFDWILTVLSLEKGVMTLKGIYDIDINHLETLATIRPDTTSFEIDSIRKPLNGVLIQNGIGRSPYLKLTKNGR